MQICDYKIGDELDLVLNDICQDEWDKNPRSEIQLHTLEAKTIWDGNKPSCICVCQPLLNGGAYVYFLMDRNARKTILREVKKLVDIYKKRFNTLYTYSFSNDKQDKMHCLLGFKETGYKEWKNG